MFILLSHKLKESTPAFAGGPSLLIKPSKQIAKGDSSNSYLVEFPNHLGTHVDAPNHFDPRGKAIAAYGIEAFIFNRPVVVKLRKEESRLILVEDLAPHEPKIARADFLILRTGFQVYREKDREKYCKHNPGFSASAARYLVRRLPSLRGVGFDFISLSSVEHREEGRQAHRILLTGRDFFIVEDMDLQDKPEDIKRVFVVPWFIEGVDSTPCTVLAELTS